MSGRINTITRQLFSFKGLLLNDVIPSHMRFCSFGSKASTYSSPSQISKLAIPPPSSIDFKYSVIEKMNTLQINPRSQVLDRPLPFNNSLKIDLPMIKTNVSYEDIKPTIEIQDPNPTNVEEKHAVRMIVIRKRKMRIHKLKKLRKRMYHVWNKIKQRRRNEKEKLFQAELMTKIREAEKFDPASYVKQKLAKSNEVLIPKLWRGKRLPEFIIKDLIDLRVKKSKENKERLERRKNMNVKASDY